MPDGNALQKQYEQLVGPGFETMHPTLEAMFDNIKKTVNSPDVDAARELCDASVWDSMDLDKIIIGIMHAYYPALHCHLNSHLQCALIVYMFVTACIFTFVKSFCPSGESSQKFETFMKSLEWKLPVVPYTWSSSPPPPPPLTTHGPLATIAREDPEGMAIAEEKLTDFFPSLDYVMSKSIGSRVGTDNLVYGPKYFVSKYEASVAFLATESFEDKESLAARMLQARFTNYGRFSCMAMKDFISAPANAAAGSNGPAAGQNINPGDYAGRFDRNWVLYFAILFTESLGKQSGVQGLEVNVLKFWKVIVCLLHVPAKTHLAMCTPPHPHQ